MSRAGGAALTQGDQWGGNLPPLPKASPIPIQTSTASLLRTILEYSLLSLLRSALPCPPRLRIVPCGSLYLAAHAPTKFQSYF